MLYKTRPCKYCKGEFQPRGSSHRYCSLECNFWYRVDKRGRDECWEWQAGVNAFGYGRIADKTNKKRYRLTHRLSYELHKGKIPDGMLVCHTCDNPACVNPRHLWLGTNADNIADRTRKGRTKHPVQKGEKHSQSKLTKNQVLEIRLDWKKGTKARAIAKKYKISEGYVYDIVKLKSWQHI